MCWAGDCGHANAAGSGALRRINASGGRDVLRLLTPWCHILISRSATAPAGIVSRIGL